MRTTALAGGAVLLLAGSALLSLMVGALAVSPADVFNVLLFEGSPEARLAVALRAPRILGAVLVGAGLATAGAAFQVVFRNPLVAPDLLGVSSGAALGAALVLLLGGAFAAVQLAGFLGGLLAVTVAMLAAQAARGADPQLSLVLCGIVTGALASAGLALVLTVADPYTQLPAISYWLLGSLSRSVMSEVGVAAAPAGLGLLVLLALGSRLDALALGDEQARALGLPAGPARMVVIVAATLATAACVSIAGVVGWIGLMAPHAARLLVGSRARRLLPASAVLGAVFVMAIDAVARSAGPIELPLGLLAAAVGAPAFLVLFVVGSRR